MRKCALVFICCFLQLQALDAYSTASKLKVLNLSGSEITNFDVNDSSIVLQMEADFCTYPELSTGSFYFELEIEAPNGRISYTAKSETITLPLEGKLVSYKFTVPIRSMTRGTGIYKFKGKYSEILNNQTLVSTDSKRAMYSTKNFDPTRLVEAVKLISPINNVKIHEKLPLFQWRPVNSQVPVTYSIWISENENPLNGTILKKTGIAGGVWHYPAGAQSLESGRIYHWRIRAIDGNGQPIGGMDGYSETGSFLYDPGFESMELIYPVNETVTAEKVEFSWQDSPEATHYNVFLASDDGFSDIIQVFSSDVSRISVEVRKIKEEKNLSTIYWKVEAINNIGDLTARSGIAPVKLGPFPVKKEKETIAPSGISGTVRNVFNQSMAEVTIFVARDLKAFEKIFSGNAAPEKDMLDNFLGAGPKINGVDHNISAVNSTGRSDQLGEYRIPMDPGEYEILFYFRDHKPFTGKIRVTEGKYVRFDGKLIPLLSSVEGKISDFRSGKSLAGAKIVFRNSANIQSAVTDDSGMYHLSNLLDGEYTVEILRDPDYHEKIISGFRPGSRKLIRYNETLIPYLSGSLQVSVRLNGKPADDLRVWVKALEVDRDSNQGDTEAQGITDAQGELQLRELKTGLYRVFAESAVVGISHTDAKVLPGDVTRVTLDLEDNNVSVSGRIIGEKGEPIAGAIISVRENPERRTTTDGGGKFTLKVSRGPVTLLIDAPDRELLKKEINTTRGSSTLGDIILMKCRAALEITLKAGGKPLDNAKISIGNTHGTTANGLARFTGLPADEPLTVSALLPAGWESYAVAALQIRLKAGSTGKMELIAETVAELAGLVEDQNGLPVSGAKVGDVNSDASVTTGPDGKFLLRLRKIPDGAFYSLSVSHPQAAEKLFNVDSGKNLRLKVDLLLPGGGNSQLLREKSSAYSGRQKELELLAGQYLDNLQKDSMELSQQASSAAENLKARMQCAESSAGAAPEALQKLDSCRDQLKPAILTARTLSADISAAQSRHALRKEEVADSLRLLREEWSALLAEVRSAASLNDALRKEWEEATRQSLDAIGIIETRFSADFSPAEKKLSEAASLLSETIEAAEETSEEADKNASRLRSSMLSLSSSGSELEAVKAAAARLRGKIEGILSGVQVAAEKQNQAGRDFTAYQMALRAQLADLKQFEQAAASLISRTLSLRSKVASLEETLHIRQISGFTAEITAKALPDRPGFFELRGNFEINNKVLGKHRIDLVDAEGRPIVLEVAGALPEDIRGIVSEKFRFMELLPAKYRSLFNDEGNLQINSRIPDEWRQMVESDSFLSGETGKNSPASLHLEQLPGRLAAMPIFDEKFSGISSSGLSEEDKVIISQRGSDAFVADHLNADYLNTLGISRDILTGEEESTLKTSWAQFLHGGEFRELAPLSPAAVLRLRISSGYHQFLPDDIPNAAENTVREKFSLMIPEDLRGSLPQDYSTADFDVDLIRKAENYDVSDLRGKLENGLYQYLLEKPVGLGDIHGISFHGIGISLTAVRLFYNKTAKSAAVSANCALDVEGALAGLKDLKKLRTKGDLVILPDFKYRIPKLSITPPEGGSVSIGGFPGGLTDLKFDFNEAEIQFSGSLKLAALKKSVQFKNGVLEASGDWQLKSLDLDLDPALKFSYAGWGFVISGGKYAKSGLNLTGDLKVGAPVNTRVELKNLVLGTDGGIRKAVLEGISFKMFGGSIGADKVGFQDNNGKVDLILQGAEINLAIVKDMKVKRLNIQPNGPDFSLDLPGGGLPVNKNFDFFGVGVDVKGIDFGSAKGGQILKLDGGFKFSVPTVAMKPGGFKFTPKGEMSLSSFAIEIDSGPVYFETKLKFKGDDFSGHGVLAVLGTFNVEADMVLGKKDWAVNISVGTQIPVGPVIITEIRGGLASERGQIIVSFGGSFIVTVVPIIGGGGDFIVNGSTGDLELKGNAQVNAELFKIPLADAYFLISARKLLIDGYCKVGIDSFGMEATGKTNILVSKDGWGVGSRMTVNAFGILKATGGMATGYNFPADITYKGKMANPPKMVKGMALWVDAGGKLLFFSLHGGALLHAGSPMVAGIYFTAKAKVDLIILAVAVAAYLDLGGQIGKKYTYFAGAIGAKGCISVLGFKECASKTFKFTIGEAPKSVLEADHSLDVDVGVKPGLSASILSSLPEKITVRGRVHFKNAWVADLYGDNFHEFLKVKVFAGEKALSTVKLEPIEGNPEEYSWEATYKVKTIGETSYFRLKKREVTVELVR